MMLNGWWKLKRLLNGLGTSWTGLLSVLTLVLFSQGLALYSISVNANDLDARVLGAEAVVNTLAQKMDAGNQQSIKRLKALGFDKEVSEIVKLDDGRSYNFSSRTLLETLHRRAELAKIGDGDRFLRVLYDDAAQKSAQLSQDPDFKWLREQFSAEDLDLKANPIKFVPMSELDSAGPGKPLPDAITHAINKLADSFAEPHISRVRFSMIQRLNLGKNAIQKFERAIANSTNKQQALARITKAHRPPPQVEKAMRGIIGDLRLSSAILYGDTELLSIMDELSIESELPEEHKRYAKVEASLPSRVKQMNEAASIGETGRASYVGDAFDRIVDGDSIKMSVQSATSSFSGTAVNKSAKTTTYSAARLYEQKMGSRLATHVGKANTKNYGIYTNKAFKGVSRSYKTAIRLPSLARGIAVGGTLEIEIDGKPVRAIWVPNDKDPQFGRIFVELERQNAGLGQLVRLTVNRILQFLKLDGLTDVSGGKIAVSRVLFTDSFISAAAVLLEDKEKNALFREDELLILMSMDPELEVYGGRAREARKKIEDIDQKIEDFRQEYETAFEKKIQIGILLGWNQRKMEMELDRLNSLFETEGKSLVLEKEYAKHRVPRGIVLHPSIQGREMAWTTARVDFWISDIEGLSDEAAMVNGGESMPASLMKINIEQANTWQFYERASTLRLGEPLGKALKLEVVSDNRLGSSVKQLPLWQWFAKADESTDSHFGISMFRYSDTKPMGGKPVIGQKNVFQLPQLEQELQPMLDWLAVNHHDFIRLNHFSEALSILRWLKKENAPILIMDIDGQGKPIAVPDRVYLGEGPTVKEP